MTVTYVSPEKLAEDLPLAAATLAEVHGVNKYVPRNADAPREPNTAVNEEQATLLTDVKALWEQAIEGGGVTPASFLNMHPWQVTATGPHNQGIVIPPCPIEHEFYHYIQRGPRFDFGDNGGRFKVKIIWPIEIMRDFARQHFSWHGNEFPSGGMVVYMGDQIVGQAKPKTAAATLGFFDRMQALVRKATTEKTERENLERMIEEERTRQLAYRPDGIDSDEKILKAMKLARDQQIDFYQRMFDWADQRWAEKTKPGYGSVTKNHRDIARWLHHRRQVAKLPEWVSAKPPRDFVQQFCVKCGGELSDKGYACGKCNRIDKPFAAFKDGAITKDDPAMKRCTREQLDSLGLTDILTLEEKLSTEPDEKKAKKAGKPATT